MEDDLSSRFIPDVIIEETDQDRVNRGAALLDQRWINWWNQIDPEALDMLHPSHCVLGQVYGPSRREDDFGFYLGGLDSLGLKNCYESARHGFIALRAGTSIMDYSRTEALTVLWVALIHRLCQES